MCASHEFLVLSFFHRTHSFHLWVLDDSLTVKGVTVMKVGDFFQRARRIGLKIVGGYIFLSWILPALTYALHLR